MGLEKESPNLVDMKSLQPLFIVLLLIGPGIAYGQATSSFVGLSFGLANTNAIYLRSLDGAAGSRPDQGYDVGVQYQKLIGPHFALEGGLHFTQFQYQSIAVFFPGVEVPDEDRRHRVVSLLIRPKYYFNTHRVRVYVVGGVSLDAQLSATVNEDNNTGLGAQLGAGLEASLGKRLVVNLEPNARILSLVSLRFEEGYRRHLASAGVQLGVHYAL